MKILLLFVFTIVIDGRGIRDKKVEDEPFTAANDLFSDSFAFGVKTEFLPETFSEADFKEEEKERQSLAVDELAAPPSEGPEGPPSTGGATPPGFSPQPPSIKQFPSRIRSTHEEDNEEVQQKSLETGQRFKLAPPESREIQTAFNQDAEEETEEKDDTMSQTEEPNSSTISSYGDEIQGAGGQVNEETTEGSSDIVSESFAPDVFALQTNSTQDKNDDDMLHEGSGDESDIEKELRQPVERISGEIGEDKQGCGDEHEGVRVEMESTASSTTQRQIEPLMEDVEADAAQTDIKPLETETNTTTTGEVTTTNSTTVSTTIIPTTTEGIHPPPPLDIDILPPHLRGSKKVKSKARRGAVDGCPSPLLCSKNCFIVINDDGCQDCQCLWQATTCESDSDCPEAAQQCDLGRCNCRQGFRQDMNHSGFCKIDPSEELRLKDTEVSNNHITSDFETPVKKNKFTQFTSSPRHATLKQGRIAAAAYFGLRQKRSIGEKPRDAERLEWPGPCDDDDECDEGLFCIQGDCWHLPDTSNRNHEEDEEDDFERTTLPNSFIITSDAVPSSSHTASHKTTLLPMNRGLHRYVSSEEKEEELNNMVKNEEDDDYMEMTSTMMTSSTTEATTTRPTTTTTTERTTMQPFTTQSITISNQLMNGWEHPEFTSTAVDTTVFDGPPAPPDYDQLGTVSRSLIDPSIDMASTINPSDVTPPFTKMIELPEPKIIPSRRRKPPNRRQPKQEENEEFISTTSISEIGERSFQTDGIKQIRKQQTRRWPLSSLPLESARRSPSTVSTSSPIILPTLIPSKDTTSTDSSNIPLFPISSFPTLLHPSFPQPKRSFDRMEIIAEGGIESDDVTTADTSSHQKQQIWNPMVPGEIPHLGIFPSDRRRSPQKFDVPTAHVERRIYMEYTKSNIRNKPVRVERKNAKGLLIDECHNDRDCGKKFVCCTKKWCDMTPDCGHAKFCLPSCDMTKMTYLPSLSFSSSESAPIDIIYD